MKDIQFSADLETMDFTALTCLRSRHMALKIKSGKREGRLKEANTTTLISFIPASQSVLTAIEARQIVAKGGNLASEVPKMG